MNLREAQVVLTTLISIRLCRCHNKVKVVKKEAKPIFDFIHRRYRPVAADLRLI